MTITPFALEQWMGEHETNAKYNLAETCAAPISIEKLASYSEQKIPPEALLNITEVQNYGHVKGSPALKRTLSGLYSVKAVNRLDPENIVITNGAIGANHLVFYSLVGRGDHVICNYPTYQQLYSVPESLGAEVDLWKCKPEKKWVPDIEELKKLIKPNTKLIVLTNPGNPHGQVIPKSLMTSIIEVAQENGNIPILADEVYRPLFHSIGPADKDFPPSLMSLPYDHAIVTGSLSKAYSLAGIRVGWVAARDPKVVQAVLDARDYTHISVSKLDQQIATFALSSGVMSTLLGKNIQLARSNLEKVEDFVSKHSRMVEWVKPKAGTTAFVKFTRDGKPINSAEFCKKLQEETGVFLVPGDVGFGAEWEGYVRIGFVPEEETLVDGIEQLTVFMRNHYDSVPTM